MASRWPQIDLSPDGRLGALVLGALFGLMIIPAAETQVVSLTSYSYYNNVTNTIYPGWNTKITVTGEIFNVSWITPYGFTLTYETVENNYPWLSYITPTADVNGGRIYDRAALCQPLVTRFGPVSYLNSTKMMQDYAREDLRHPFIIDSLRWRNTTLNPVKEFLPECGFFLEFDSLRQRRPGTVKRLNGEYYAANGFFVNERMTDTGVVAGDFSELYGPIYFNMDFCGHYCDNTDIAALGSTVAEIQTVNFVGRGCYANPHRSVYCRPLVIQSALGVKKAFDSATSVEEFTYGGRDGVRLFIGGFWVGFNSYSQMNARFEPDTVMELARNETMKDTSLRDPKARYRQKPIRTVS